MAQIYLSSTYSDLKRYRELVYRTLVQMQHGVIAMEDYVATDQRPLAKCLADIRKCDIYILVLAWRYGDVPEQNNLEKKSITELEFRHAEQEGKTCLIFLLAEDYPWSPLNMEKGEGANRLQALRKELSDHYTVSFFRSEDDLARLVSTAVYHCNSAPPKSARRTVPAHVREPNLGQDVWKTCNRSRQATEFLDFFIPNLKARKGLPQIFFVHGEERECHNSFLDHLTDKHIEDYAKEHWGEQRGVVTFKRMAWAYEDNLEVLQQELKRMLFTELAPRYMDEDLSATALSLRISESRVPLVVIQHQISAARWNRAARELIEWYIAYWADMKINPSTPQFLIFLSIIYPPSQPSNWWRRRKTSSQSDKDRIQRELQEISASRNDGCPCRMMRELLPVRREEVKAWFSANTNYSEKTQLELVEKIFRTADGRPAYFMSMADVEHELKCLVDISSQQAVIVRGRL